MSAIQPYLLEIPTVPASQSSAPTANSTAGTGSTLGTGSTAGTSSTAGTGNSSDSPFGTYLSNATGAQSASGRSAGSASNANDKAPVASAPASIAATKSPSSLKASSPGNDQSSAKAPRDASSQPAGGGPNDPQSLLASSIAAASSAPAGNPKTSKPDAAKNSDTSATSTLSTPLLGAAPAQLVKGLLENHALGAAAAATSENSSSPGDRSPPVNAEGSGAPPALIAALGQATGARVTRSAAPVKPQSPAPSTTTSAATTAGQTAAAVADAVAAVLNIQAAASPTAAPGEATATAAAALLASDPKGTTASEAKPKKTAQDGKAAGQKPLGVVGPASTPPADSVSSTTQIATAGLSADAGGAGTSQTPQTLLFQSTPGAGSDSQAKLDGTGQSASSSAGSAAQVVDLSSHAPVGQTPFAGLTPAAGVVSGVSLAQTTATPEKASPVQSVSTGNSGPALSAQGSVYSLLAAPPVGLQNLISAHSTTSQNSTAGYNPAQVIEQVAYAIQVTHSGGQEMQLLLNPADLGALQVNVSVHDGVLSARLEAQNPTTQQILVDNLSQLKDSLTQQGVTFDRIDVHLAGSHTGSGGSGFADPSFGRQQQEALPWGQISGLAHAEKPELVRNSPALSGSGSRVPLKSLDIMV